ncbi:MAG: TonB-dependent receptor plug domain-containing protein, partial [Kordiimonas sp.]
MQTKKPSFRSKLMLGTSIAMSMAVAAPTIAQDQTTDEDVFALEEILVTATKRSESLQDVGMSITAMSALDIERSGATEFIDYAVKVPNLSFAYESDGRFDANSPSIRGVFGRNTTGFYIDDTPVPASMNPRAIDMERIEVLRGPQGSLYGARSMGGTIRLITKQPDFDDQEVKVHAKVSSVNEGDWNWSFDGSFNMPLVEDKFAIRANAYYGKNSGIFDRKHNPVTRKGSTPEYKRQDNVDDEEYAGIQIFGKAQLSENLTFSPKFMFQSVNADGLPYADIDPENTLQKRFYDLDEPGKDRWFMASGTFNW